MADVTNPVAPGGQTSEGSLTKIIHVVAGVVFVAAAACGEILKQFPNATWISGVAMALSAAVSILNQLGYSYSRTAIKTAMIANPPPAPDKPNP